MTAADASAAARQKIAYIYGSMSTDPTAAKRPAVYRTRFFVASLWAALVPMLLLAAGCLVVLLLPEGNNKVIETARRAAGVAMILVPFFYTGLVIVIYGIARLLHLINLLSRWTLLAMGVVLSAVAAALVAWGNVAVKAFPVNTVVLFVIALVASALALGAACWFWWRVASRIPPPSVPKKKHRRTHTVRNDAGEPEV